SSASFGIPQIDHVSWVSQGRKCPCTKSGLFCWNHSNVKGTLGASAALGDVLKSQEGDSPSLHNAWVRIVKTYYSIPGAKERRQFSITVSGAQFRPVVLSLCFDLRSCKKACSENSNQRRVAQQVSLGTLQLFAPGRRERRRRKNVMQNLERPAAVKMFATQEFRVCGLRPCYSLPGLQIR